VARVKTGLLTSVIQMYQNLSPSSSSRAAHDLSFDIFGPILAGLFWHLWPNFGWIKEGRRRMHLRNEATATLLWPRVVVGTLPWAPAFLVASPTQQAAPRIQRWEPLLGSAGKVLMQMDGASVCLSPLLANSRPAPLCTLSADSAFVTIRYQLLSADSPPNPIASQRPAAKSCPTPSGSELLQPSPAPPISTCLEGAHNRED
jgi:hypothetical protein